LTSHRQSKSGERSQVLYAAARRRRGRSGVVRVSIALGSTVSPYFYWFTAFVGLNRFQSAFTNWCPMMSILRMLGVRD
jgi:hypothetical protein